MFIWLKTQFATYFLFWHLGVSWGRGLKTGCPPPFPRPGCAPARNSDNAIMFGKTDIMVQEWINDQEGLGFRDVKNLKGRKATVL